MSLDAWLLLPGSADIPSPGEGPVADAAAGLLLSLVPVMYFNPSLNLGLG